MSYNLWSMTAHTHTHSPYNYISMVCIMYIHVYTYSTAVRTLSEDPIIDHIDARFMAGAETLIYGTRKVLCVSGNSPGVRVDGTFWEKTDVINENVLDVTAQCPDCTSCDDEERLLSIPSVVNQSDHNYSAYLVALSYFADDTDEYRDCFDTPSVYISFLVINSVQKDDGGRFEFNVVSGVHRRKSESHYTTIGEL